MNASGTVISDFIYFFVPIALLPICRNRATIKTRSCNFRGRRLRLSGGVDARRAAVEGRNAASGNVMPSIYRFRQVGPTKDSQIVFDYGIGNSRNYLSIPDAGQNSDLLEGPQSFAWRTFCFGRVSGRLSSDAARSRQAEVLPGSGRSAVG